MKKGKKLLSKKIEENIKIVYFSTKSNKHRLLMQVIKKNRLQCKLEKFICIADKQITLIISLDNQNRTRINILRE